jgi:hypothetical protein
LSSPGIEPVRTHAPNPTLDMRVCTEIGARLARLRTERGQSVADLTGKLLLSAKQVRALETADVSAFHNAAFFMIGLRKYAALCGIDRAAVDAAVVEAQRFEQAVVAALPASPERTSRPRGWTPIVAILSVCIAMGMGWGLVRWARARVVASTDASTSTSAAASSGSSSSTASGGASLVPLTPGVADPAILPQDANATAPPGEVPAAAPPSHGAGSLGGQVTYGSLWSPQRAWMFLRMEDDTVIERTVVAGELVQLPSRPKYLAIGADDAELTIGSTPIDVSRFVQRGTLRMGVAEFGVAEQSALGGPAPDPTDNSAR